MGRVITLDDIPSTLDVYSRAVAAMLDRLGIDKVDGVLMRKKYRIRIYITATG